MDTQKLERARRLDAVVWALFFIWAGVALLADLGWSYSLFGIAAIILGGETYRWYKGLEVQIFWISVGLMCLLVATLEQLSITWQLMPLLFIGFGLALLLSILRKPAS